MSQLVNRCPCFQHQLHLRINVRPLSTHVLHTFPPPPHGSVNLFPVFSTPNTANARNNSCDRSALAHLADVLYSNIQSPTAGIGIHGLFPRSNCSSHFSTSDNSISPHPDWLHPILFLPSCLARELLVYTAPLEHCSATHGRHPYYIQNISRPTANCRDVMRQSSVSWINCVSISYSFDYIYRIQMQ